MGRTRPSKGLAATDSSSGSSILDKKKTKSDDVSLKEQEQSEWVDDSMDIDDDDEAHEEHDQHEESASDSDDPDSSLARLSQQYRRFSESQRNFQNTQSDHDSEEEDENESADREEEEEEEEEDYDDDINEDMMRSIQRTHEGQIDDDEDENESNNHEGSDSEEIDPSEVFHGALRSLANRLAEGSNMGSSQASGSARTTSDTIAENMARLFPEALGLFEGLGGGASISGLVQGLSRRDDPYLVLETLNELSSRLLMMNGAVAERGLPVTELSRALVGILNDPILLEELELQLVACRCLYNFLEINPEYVHSVVHAGAIEALQSKLLEISYIDLAEQALQTLEFISRVAGRQIFKKNCLSSCLQYLDFFTIHAQRKAVNITANSVKHIKHSQFHLVEELLPTLERIVIDFTDSQELESAWLAIARIIKNFGNTTLLERLITPDLLMKMISVVSNSDTTLATNLRLINSLSICAQNKKLSSLIIENTHLVESVNNALSKYKKGTSDSGITIEVLMAVPKDLTIAILDLFIDLLPIEPNSVFTFPQGDEKDYASIYEAFKVFLNEAFPLFINIYQSSVLFDIRRRVIVCLIRTISALKDIKDLENPVSLTNLLASIVIQNKSIIRTEQTNNGGTYITLLGALIITQTLIEKDPDFYIPEFEREGLLSDLSSLLEILRADANYNENLANNDYDNVEEVEEEEVEEEGQGDYYVDEEENYGTYEDSEDDEDDDSQFLSASHGYGYPLFKNLNVGFIVNRMTKATSNIEQIYLSKKASGDSKLEHLRLLDELAGDLTNKQLIESYNYQEWVNIWNLFEKTLSQGSSTISSFQLISSGIIEVLSTLFSDLKYGSEGCVCRNAFLDVFRGESFEVLVKKLQESLTRSESFEIIGCGLKTEESKVASLGKQLKVKLSVIDDEENVFEDMNHFVILVHAIAAFSNIGTFLKRRVEAPLIFGARRPTSATPNGNWYIEFLLDDEVIPSDTTIYGALYKHLQAKNPHFDTNRFWYEIHEIKFRKVQGTQPALELDDRYPESSVDEFDSPEYAKTVATLNLLRCLHNFNENSQSFLNFKLTAKLNRQLEEPLIVASGILPTWSIHITRKYPFLFPLETRIFFLQSTSFGYSRLVQLWNLRVNQEEMNSNGNNNNNNSSNIPLGRPTKYKVRVSRNHLLPSAYKVLEKLGTNPGILEVEFNDEVGTGLGPTLEFYSSVSHAFAQKKLGIWRVDEADNEDDVVHSKNGLFPAPLNPNSSDYVTKVEHFKYLGKFIARALLDNRIVDVNLNKLFFELAALEVTNPDHKLPKVTAFTKLRYVDPQLYDSLKFMKENKSAVASLSLSFTLPGYEDIELIPNGADVPIDESNVDDFIDKVVEYTIGSGVKEQVEAFVAGFSEVFPFFALLIFSPNELVELLGKCDEDWSYDTLVSSIHADHGYNIDSPTVQNLLTTLSKFDLSERRLFLQFLTGSPRLPIGGFKNLKPVFTVVLKHSEQGYKPDDYLPSVMTCANYLKLPNYSSLEVLQQRLLQAVNEGAGAFLLS